tara:strand:- start:29 stop:358 length:330 start_codon:yes stop_codon:yes gene_type:complete
LGTAIVGAPEFFDVMKLQIKVENNKIVDAKFKTFCCGSAIANSSHATECVKGKSIDEEMFIQNTEIVTHNFHAQQLRFIILFLLRTQLRQDSVIIKIARLLNPRKKIVN